MRDKYYLIETIDNNWEVASNVRKGALIEARGPQKTKGTVRKTNFAAASV